MAQLKAKRTQLTLMQNIEILDGLNAQRKITEIAAQFICDRSTISKLMKNKGKFRQEDLTNKKSKKVRSCKSNFQDGEEAPSSVVHADAIKKRHSFWTLTAGKS